MVDRRGGAKGWLVAGYGLASLARPLYVLAGAVEPGRRGLAFGLHRAMDNAGAVIGPLAAAGLLVAWVGLGGHSTPRMRAT